jgi:uncharacterized protein YodC (DUF2158 family)
VFTIGFYGQLRQEKSGKGAMTVWGVNQSAMVSCLFRWFRVYKQRPKSKSIGSGSQRRSLVYAFEKGGVSLLGIISFGVAFCLLELLIYVVLLFLSMPRNRLSYFLRAASGRFACEHGVSPKHRSSPLSGSQLSVSPTSL